MNGVREVEPNLVKLRNNVELFTSLDEVLFKIKVANQNLCRWLGRGDVHIPGLGRIKEVLFIPEIPYNVLAIIKLIKGTKISLFYTHHEYHAQVIANFQMMVLRMGRKKERDDNADSDTSDEEIEGKVQMSTAQMTHQKKIFQPKTYPGDH
ncbi:hypothetical protein E2320_002292 [Naja naja]|nr:hypothetical protein E2320_002292 [Naja naja]